MAELFEMSIRTIWTQKIKELNQGIIIKNQRINELREKEDNFIEKICLLSNKDAIQRIETQYEEIKHQREILENQRNEKEYSEKDVERIVKFARHFVEHIDQLILESDDQGVLQSFWGLIFDMNPTINEIKSGTAKISCVVKLKERFDDSNGVLAVSTALVSYTLHFLLYLTLKMRQMRHYKKGCLNII